MTEENAIELLGEYAFVKNQNKLLHTRIERLIEFANRHKADNIQIETNKNHSLPPKPKSAIDYKLLGGTTHQYHVWAVVRQQ